MKTSGRLVSHVRNATRPSSRRLRQRRRCNAGAVDPCRPGHAALRRGRAPIWPEVHSWLSRARKRGAVRGPDAERQPPARPDTAGRFFSRGREDARDVPHGTGRRSTGHGLLAVLFWPCSPGVAFANREGRGSCSCAPGTAGRRRHVRRDGRAVGNTPRQSELKIDELRIGGAEGHHGG